MRPLIELVGNALMSQNNNIHKVAAELNMTQAQIIEIMKKGTQYSNTTYNFTPVIINHNTKFEQINQAIHNTKPQEVHEERRSARSRSKGDTPVVDPQSEAPARPRGKLALEDAPAKPDKRKASKSAEKEDIPVRERTKSVGPPLPVVDPPKITPAIPAAPAKSKSPDFPRSRSKELPPPEAKEEKLAIKDKEQRSRTPAKRAAELLNTNLAKKRTEILSGRVELGSIIKATKAKNASDAAAEPKIVVTKRGRVPNMVARIEGNFKETDLSPRNRKTFRLDTQTFKARPRMSSLPAPILRIAPSALVQ